MASERIQRQIERLLDQADEAVARYDWEAVRNSAPSESWAPHFGRP